MEAKPIPREWNLRVKRKRHYTSMQEMAEGARLGRRKLDLRTIKEIETGDCADINRLRPYLEMLGLELSLRPLK